MPLTWLAVSTMAAGCAPMAAPSTLAAVATVESGLDPLAIGVNGAHRQQAHPGSFDEAVATAHRLLAAGRNIDLGLAQINSANLASLGLTVSDALTPCPNLRAAGQVLQRAYWSQSPNPGREQAALRTALSIYNTGRTDRGFRNGYVAKVSAAAGLYVPAPVLGQTEEPPSPPVWDVFATARTSGRLVFTSADSGGVP
jgi:type IV secretion system protein VirB1